MGHFTHNCKLSNLPIRNKIGLILIKPQENLYEYSEDGLKKYGHTYMCSNDTTRLKFVPVAFTIMGDYDEYGGITNIIEDDNVKTLEEYFKLPIETICGVVTSSRKDDGYDDILKQLMVDPENYEYDNPIYKDEYKELLSLSGMWVHGEFYEKLTSIKRKDSSDKLDLGTPEMLEQFGFIETGIDVEEQRYNRIFEKDGFTVKSDGTWLKICGEKSIFYLDEFFKYLEDHNINIDNKSEYLSKCAVEQTIDYVIPKMGNLFKPKMSDYNFKGLTDEEMDVIIDEIYSLKWENSNILRIKSYLLNGTYSSYNVSGITKIYFEKCKEGKLKDNIIRFNRFDKYMFATGNFYDIVGTGPQDGDDYLLKDILDIASEINNKDLERYLD